VAFIYALIVVCLWQYDVGDDMEKKIAMKSSRRLRLSFPLEEFCGFDILLLVCA